MSVHSNDMFFGSSSLQSADQVHDLAGAESRREMPLIDAAGYIL